MFIKPAEVMVFLTGANTHSARHKNSLITKLKECGLGRLPHEATIIADQFLEQWLMTGWSWQR
jgi:hypothetical protein